MLKDLFLVGLTILECIVENPILFAFAVIGLIGLGVNRIAR